MAEENEIFEDDGTENKSKTRKKKDAARLQALGEELMALPAQKLKRMDLPEDLKAALFEGKTITANVAARRHRQYIGVLMRDMDPDEVRMAMALSADDVVPEVQRESLSWAARLTADGPEPVEEFLAAYPSADRQRLRQLARNAAKERQAGKSGKAADALKQAIGEAVRGG